MKKTIWSKALSLFMILLAASASAVQAQTHAKEDAGNHFLPEDTTLCANSHLLFEIPAEYHCTWLSLDSLPLPYGQDTNRFLIQGQAGTDGMGGGVDARRPSTYLLRYQHQDSATASFDTMQVYALIRPTVEIEMDSALICRDEPVLVSPDYALVYEPFYETLWSDGSTEADLESNIGATHTVTMRLKDSLNSCGFSPATDSIVLVWVDTALTNMPAILRADTTICPDLELELDATVPYASTQYQWRNSEFPEEILPTDTLFDPNPVYVIEEDGTYSIVLIDSMGCINAMNINVQDDPEECKPNLQIPDVITPNGDGLNDDLTFQELKYCEDVEIEIVTRWGQVVLKEKVKRADDFKWNGCYKNGSRPLPDGPYFYMVTYKNMYGKKKVQSGSVTILGSTADPADFSY